VRQTAAESIREKNDAVDVAVLPLVKMRAHARTRLEYYR
jgi:hypothetical protein